MRHCVAIIAAALAASLAGCQSAGARSCDKQRPDHRGGPTVVAQIIELKPLVFHQAYPIDRDRVLRLDVAGSGRTCHILAGPNPGGGGATIRYSNPNPDIYVENGWAYVVVEVPSTPPASGPVPEEGSQWGQARTSRAEGTAEGTRFIVQEEGGVHRVILLSGPPQKDGGVRRAIRPSGPPHAVHVCLDGQPNDPPCLTEAKTYVELGPGQSRPQPVQHITDPTSLVAQLVAYVENVAASAGVP